MSENSVDYEKAGVTKKIMQLTGRDINGQTSAKRVREGMDYRHILVLVGVRPGYSYTLSK